MDDEPLVDRYLLQFWPAPAAPDRIIRQTSASAAYWHDFARTQPPPPTPEERAEAERHVALARERREASLRLANETRDWGGSLPSDRLRKLGWQGINVARLDRPLLDAVDRADAVDQRAIARWSARRAFVEAQLADVDWLASALDAMDRGEELSELFQESGAWERMWSDDRIPSTLITTLDGRTDNFHQQSIALPALRASYAEDPLAAALDTIKIAADTYGYGRPDIFFTALRKAFPFLDHR